MKNDATEKYDEELTDERLFAWQAALFPPGRSGMDRINAGVWRDDSGGPMQVISVPVEREIQANELVPVLTFFYRKDHPSIWSS